MRKQVGHDHIPQKHAPAINEFCEKYLNPFLNFHRPCAFATEKVDKKGKVRKVYKQEDYKIPVDRLLAIPNVEKYFKDGVTIGKLKEKKFLKNHFDFASEVSEARNKLFTKIRGKK